MRATDFEYRHQTLVHQLVVAAFLAYAFQPDDVVSWLVKKSASAPWFGAGTVHPRHAVDRGWSDGLPENAMLLMFALL
jgi:hypothetical protein